MGDDTNIWKIFGVVLFIILAFGIFTFFTKGFSFTGMTGRSIASDELSITEIQGKMETLLQVLIPPSIGTASITGVTEKSGVYQVKVSTIVNGATEDSTVFITKDGKILFLQGIDLDASIESLYSKGSTSQQG